MKKLLKYLNFDNILLFFLLLVLIINISPQSILRIGDYFLLTIAIIATAPVIFSAYKSIINKRISIDLLASIALIFSLLAHEWVSAIFINLMLTSARILLSYNEANARKSIEKLLKLKPSKIKIKTNGKISEIPLNDVKIGDMVVVELGERIPIDGKVTSGKASVDESSLTGESMPILKERGDSVLSSALITSGNLIIKTEKIGAETTLDKIIKLVEQSQIDKPDIHTLADKFATWYLITVFFASIIMYYFTRDMTLILAVLLVVCADDVAVAVPLTFLTAISYCAKRGIIVKGASYLEALRDVKVIFVDKTGTLTKGKLKVEKFFCESSNRERILKYTGILAILSDHPISKAIVSYIENDKNEDSNTKTPDSFQEESGKGMTAIFGEDKVIVGKLSYFEEIGIKINSEIKGRILAEEENGFNATLVSLNGLLEGYFTLADELKDNMRDSMDKLKALGVERIIMLTGDNEKVAQRISDSLGLTEYHANLTPEEKIDFIKKTLSDKYKTLMIGDGINDAASLGLADIGIAMGGIGYDVAIESANIVLMRDDFSEIPELISLSQYVMKIANQDFWIWGFSNVVGLLLVFSTILRPTGASAYNFLTDFIPLINSTRVFKLFRRENV